MPRDLIPHFAGHPLLLQDRLDLWRIPESDDIIRLPQSRRRYLLDLYVSSGAIWLICLHN